MPSMGVSVTAMRNARSKIALLAAAVMLAVVALGAAASAHKFSADSTVNGHYSKRSHMFKGKVSSKRSFCVRNRTVKVFKQDGGADTQVGKAQTDSGGYYKIPDPNPHGKYYAQAAMKHRKKYGHRHHCNPATSNAFFVK